MAVKYRKPPETHRLKISVSIAPAMLALVDERAREKDFPRSLIIQEALRMYFAESSEKS